MPDANLISVMAIERWLISKANNAWSATGCVWEPTETGRQRVDESVPGKFGWFAARLMAILRKLHQSQVTREWTNASWFESINLLTNSINSFCLFLKTGDHKAISLHLEHFKTIGLREDLAFGICHKGIRIGTLKLTSVRFRRTNFRAGMSRAQCDCESDSTRDRNETYHPERFISSEHDMPEEASTFWWVTNWTSFFHTEMQQT
jgi:hypothetical protein